MEVPGRFEDGSSTNTTNRNVIVDLVCQPCEKDGIRIKADGFCVDCEEHLCLRCFQTHTKPAPCRHHVLRDKEAMPKVQQRVVPKAYDELDLCGKHRDERLKFWCRDHSLVACSVCITLQHRLCKVDYIPDLAQTVTKSEEYSQLRQEMKLLKERCQASMNISEKASNQIENDYKEILNEIKAYRKEINEYLDSKEQEILEKAKTHAQHEKKQLQKISRDSESMMNEIVEYELRFKQLESAYKFNSLFTEIKTAKDYVKTMIEKESVKKTDPKRVKFVRSTLLSDVLNKTVQLGTLIKKGLSSRKPDPVSLRQCDEITVKLMQQFSPSTIWGIVGISDAVLALEVQLKTLLLYDVKKKTVLAEQTFSDWIDDIVGMSQGKLAILQSSEKLIRVLSTSGYKLSEEKSITTQEKYSSMAYCLNGLIVTVSSSYPGRVLMIDFYGNVVREIVKTESLYCPNRTVVGDGDEFIYVSDSKHSITQMTLQGEIVAVFREDGYFSFGGMQELSDGTLIVRCGGNDTLLRISSNCTRLELRGIEKKKFWNLCSICFSKSCQKLYVACSATEDGHRDTIKVFDVRY